MTAKRPYIKLKIEDLEALAAKSAGKTQVVTDLMAELRFRSSQRAVRLLRELSKSSPSKSPSPSPATSAPQRTPRQAAAVTPGPAQPTAGAPSTDGPLDWDDRQKSVINSPAKARLLVAAGPGMGKTAVACGRVVSLLRAGLEPSHICLISFTRTAVQEIRDRMRRLSGDNPGVNAIRVATIDSHAWQLLQGFDPASAKVFGGYEQNIEALIQRLIRKDPALLEFLAGIEHLTVDEAQDVVGLRADLLVALIRALPGACGVSVFTDDAQAIYGFTDADDADDEPPDNLPARIRSGDLKRFEEIELQTIHRTSRTNLATLFKTGRGHAITAHRNPAQAQKKVRECVAKYADGTLEPVEKQELRGQHDTLVLFRTRAEVLEASSYLSEVDHRIRMSGMAGSIHPWLGLLFWDCTQDRMTEEAFSALWEDRVRAPFPSVDRTRAWRVLRGVAGEGKVLRMGELRSRLATRAVPVDLMVPERGFSGPILGTIHASKGREASTVHLMMPEASDKGAAGEARVTFVGATRAKDKLCVGQGKKLFPKKTATGRVFMKARHEYRARVEVGRDGDVDLLSQGRRDAWTSEEAMRAQSFLRRHATSNSAALLRADPSKDFRYAIECDLEGKAERIGFASSALNSDLFSVAHALWGRARLRPAPEIRHVRYLGACTIVPTPEQREVLLEPFNESGFLLAPIISALTTVFYFKY